MYLNYKQLNKFTIKDKFQIIIINELLAKLSGVVYIPSWISIESIMILKSRKKNTLKPSSIKKPLGPL